jgi:hypothetical protein
MKAKKKIKKDRGLSIKIETTTYDKLKSYCQERCLIIGHFATRAIEEKLETSNHLENQLT